MARTSSGSSSPSPESPALCCLKAATRARSSAVESRIHRSPAWPSSVESAVSAASKSSARTSSWSHVAAYHHGCSFGLRPFFSDARIRPRSSSTSAPPVR